MSPSNKRKNPRKHHHNKKQHTKRKKAKKQSIHTINLILTILLITTTVSMVSYFVFFDNWDKTEKLVKTAEEKLIEQLSEDDHDHDLEDLPEDADKYFEEKTEEFDKIYLTEKPEDISKPTEEKKDEKIEESKKDPLSLEEEKKPKQEAIKPQKPMLAIVLDDVSWKAQVRQIQSVGYIVNMSFLPPTPRHKNSANIAVELEHYMVHLPMQATSFKFEEEDTLHIGDSYEKIEKRVSLIRKLYPEAKYVNNHTGSKFTADFNSMDKLMRALKKYDFYFLDSRTTPKSKARETAKKHGVKFITRNIFLDNEKDFDYIQGQLKKALKIAKKRGYAIAIGHPYKITTKVLRESKHLLEDFELVYIDKIPFH